MGILMSYLRGEYKINKTLFLGTVLILLFSVLLPICVGGNVTKYVLNSNHKNIGQLKNNNKFDEIPEGTVYTIADDGDISYATHGYSEAIISNEKKVYFSYLANDYSSKVWSYNIETYQKVGPINITGGTRLDGHSYPNIIMDDEGFIHIFYGTHCSPQCYRKTINPCDISAWTEEIRFGNETTYPRPFIRDNGNIVLFYREGNRSDHPNIYGYIESSDGGNTWSELRPLIRPEYKDGEYPWAYVGGVFIDRDDIYICWSTYTYYLDTGYADLRYARFNFNNNLALDEFGDVIGTIPIRCSDVIPLSAGANQYAEDIVLDDQKRPVILFSDFDESGEDGVKVAWWNGSTWDLKMLDNAVRFNQRFARNPFNWIIICSRTWAGAELFQKKVYKSNWTNNFFTSNKGIHPLINADTAENKYHIFWSESGSLKYLWIKIFPEKPVITGSERGKPGEEYQFSAVSSANKDLKLSYKWYWGDGEETKWLGEYDSEVPCNISHAWNNIGNYKISVKAKDSNDFESPWTEIEIKISNPRIRIIKTLFLEKIFEKFQIISRALSYL